MKYRFIIVFLCATLIVRFACALGKQTVGAKGRLLCGSKPSAGTLVKLWDEDTGPDPDDLMATTNADSNGDFQLSGSESEIGNIDPWLKIYHNCNNKWSVCKRKIKYKIPSSYIASGDSVKQWFDLGVVNLEPKQPGEETECLG